VLPKTPEFGSKNTVSLNTLVVGINSFPVLLKPFLLAQLTSILQKGNRFCIPMAVTALLA
jgi:hypothetical protein